MKMVSLIKMLTVWSDMIMCRIGHPPARQISSVIVIPFYYRTEHESLLFLYQCSIYTHLLFTVLLLLFIWCQHDDVEILVIFF